MQSLKLGLIMMVAVIAVTAQAYVPQGAFLRRPVKNTADLVAHVKTDPVVMERFVRHFRMKPAQVVSYFQTLHLAKLTRDGSYNVFNIHEDNVIRSRTFMLKKGTLVFADENGRPILKKECANPMVFEIPPLGSEPGVTAPVGSVDQPGEPTSEEIITPLEPSVMPVVEVGPPPIAPVLPDVQSGSVSGGSTNFLPLLLLGGLFFINPGGDDCPPPVPEPATMLILGAGAAAMIAKKRRK